MLCSVYYLTDLQLGFHSLTLQPHDFPLLKWFSYLSTADHLTSFFGRGSGEGIMDK